MNTKLQKTILGSKIEKFQFYKMHVARLNQQKTFGFIWLEDSKVKIRIEYGKFFTMNSDGKNTGIILKASKSYRKIKRMISIWFRNYRKLSQNKYLIVS